jgi:hypothetical protein
MRQYGTYIALFMTLLFAFPIAYQPLHMAVSHNHHEQETCCEHHHHTSTDSETPVGDVQLSASADQCAVCDYEFAVFKTHQGQTHVAYIPFVFAELTSFYENHVYTSLLLALTLRGPPAIA